jgi:aldehyde dehydrogenase (NAD+)
VSTSGTSLRCDHLIDGRDSPPASGGYFPVSTPETGALLGHAAAGTAADVARAVHAASVAHPAWAAAAPAERERVLLRAAELIERRGTERFLDLLIDESGSTAAKARFEIGYAASLLRAAAGEARRLYGDTFPDDRPSRLSLVVREPLGVVAVIAPCNAPLALLAKMLAFPLAAGNSCVVKPSEETPLCALRLGQLLHEAGLPPGVCNVVTGTGPACGEALVDHPEVRGIAFTGSTTTGKRIAARAQSRMCRSQLELGGKNPVLVLADAEPETAARELAAGAFYHAGQICMAPARIIVEAPLAEAVASALVAAARALVLGDLRAPGTSYGPLINQRALDKVRGQIEQALATGARLLTGGQVRRGLIHEPTVLWNPPRDSAVWREETFGPVVSVVPAADLEEAIALANDSSYGLSAAVLSNDLRRSLAAARRIRAGAVHVGMHCFQSGAMAPIGGVGDSGQGRSGGKYSTESFTELKWISAELDTPAPHPGQHDSVASRALAAPRHPAQPQREAGAPGPSGCP